MPSLRHCLFGLTLAGSLATAAAATTPALNTADAHNDYDEYAPASISDPLEGFNRRVSAFNDWTYDHLLRPAIRGYEWVVRPPVNQAIGNFYDNVRYPVRLVNSLLQGKVRRAGLETAKFAVNTTAGLGGFIRQSDQVPALADVPAEDFGQTLGVWGVPHGPYLVLPILGGTSLRDLGGRAADTVTSPLGWQYIELGGREWTDELDWEWQTTITVTDTMSSLPSALEAYDQAKAGAVDPYTAVRDGLRRFRDAQTAR